MKILLLRNRNEIDYELGYVLYYEKTKTFNIELKKDINPIKLPIALDIFFYRNIFSINSYYSKLWLQDRVIPIDRQNIGSILKEAKLKEYDLFSLLVLNHGRCTNDEFELVKIKQLPNEILERFKHKVSDVLPIKNNRIICFFKDGKCKKIDIGKLKQNDRLYSRVLNNTDEFKEVYVLPGGYGISFGNNLDIDDETLYQSGKNIDIEYEDFICFVNHNVVDTSNACKILDCSRQNIDDLIKRNKLSPIKESDKYKLFLSKDIKERIDY